MGYVVSLVVLLAVGLSTGLTAQDQADPTEAKLPSVLDLTTTSNEDAVVTLSRFLKQHRFAVGEQVDEGIGLAVDGVRLLVLPKTSADGLDRLIVSRLFRLRPRYRGTTELDAFCRRLNQTQDFWQVAPSQRGELLVLLSHITFVDRLEAEELRAFLDTAAQTVRGAVLFAPDFTEYTGGEDDKSRARATEVEAIVERERAYQEIAGRKLGLFLAEKRPGTTVLLAWHGAATDHRLRGLRKGLGEVVDIIDELGLGGESAADSEATDRAFHALVEKYKGRCDLVVTNVLPSDVTEPNRYGTNGVPALALLPATVATDRTIEESMCARNVVAAVTYNPEAVYDDEPPPADLDAAFAKRFALLQGDSVRAKEFFAAAMRGDVAAVRELLNRDRNLARAESVLGWTALHVAALYKHQAIIELLLSEGVPLDLQLCAMLGDLEQARALIAQGADVNAPSAAGWEPLHWAARRGHDAVAGLLIARGADVEPGNTRMMPLEWAAINGHMSVAVLLIEKGADANVTGGLGWSPLHSAARKGNLDVARLLVANGADLDPRAEPGDGSRRTPLHLAADEGQSGMVRFLVDQGANVNPRDSQGQTPLHCAVRRNHAETVRLLVERGANMTAKDKKGRTPLDVANVGGRNDIAALLRKRIEEQSE